MGIGLNHLIFAGCTALLGADAQTPMELSYSFEFSQTQDTDEVVAPAPSPEGTQEIEGSFKFTPTTGSPLEIGSSMSFVNFPGPFSFPNAFEDDFPAQSHDFSMSFFSMGTELNSVAGLIGLEASEKPNEEAKASIQEDIARTIGVPIESVHGVSIELDEGRNGRRLVDFPGTYYWTVSFSITVISSSWANTCGWCSGSTSISIFVQERCSSPSFQEQVRKNTCVSCQVGPVECRPRPPPPHPPPIPPPCDFCPCPTCENKPDVTPPDILPPCDEAVGFKCCPKAPKAYCTNTKCSNCPKPPKNPKINVIPPCNKRKGFECCKSAPKIYCSDPKCTNCPSEASPKGG